MRLFRNKKIRIMLLTTLLAALLATGCFATKITAKSNLNVRAKTSTSSKVLSVFKKGATRTVLGTKGNWYKVKVNGKTGYVSKKYVVIGSSLNTNNSDNDSSSSAFGTKVVTQAKKHLGKPYVWGATGPNSFDCSGLTQYVYKKCGKSIPRVAADQYSASKKVSKSNLQKGDLVFFSSTAGGSYVGHVGIYIGSNKMIHAANSKVGVVTTNLNDSYYVSHYVGAGRY